MPQDLMWRTEVTHSGKRVGYQENGWFALPEEEVAQMQEEGKKCLMFAVAQANKGNGSYAMEFTGTVTDTDSGVATPDPVVKAEGLTFASLNRYLRKAQKLSNWLVDWSDDDEEHGKPSAWDHSKAKEHKPKPKE